MLLTKEVKNLLTKMITDPYGRKLGKIIAFSIDFKENIEFIGIELSNGDFSYYLASQISIENDSVILNNLWQNESIHLAEEFALILRKNSTLNELYNKGEIPQEIYDEIRKQYDAAIKDITERCKILSEDQKKRIDALNIQIKELKTFLTKMKIEYSLDKDNEKYKVSLLTIQTILNRALSEKKDIEIALNNIPKNPTLTQTIPYEQPQIATKAQPIVLRIKEAES